MKEAVKNEHGRDLPAYGALLAARTAITEDLRAGRLSGMKCALKLAEAMDGFIQSLCADIFTSSPREFAVLALGGYGRKELCPFSDIELLFLIRENLGAEEQARIENFLYTIWDCGIKIGHVARTPRECLAAANEDPKTISNMLDARLIWGDPAFFTHLMEDMERGRTAKSRHKYTLAKLEEREARHQRLGEIRYVLEPNIKEGKGGLRDFQTLFCITQMHYGAKTPSGLARLGILSAHEKSKFRRAQEFLMSVRAHLHDLAGRAEERLHFDIQPRLAERLGYKNKDNAKAVERFMKHYFRVTRDIGDLTRIVCAAIEETEKTPDNRPLNGHKGYEITNGRLNFSRKLDLKKHPIEMIRFFRIAQKTRLDMHPAALRALSRNAPLLDAQFCRNAEANALFLQILCEEDHAYPALKRMSGSGVLERFIPGFRRAIGLMQFDRYHMYTVDEHTLNAIRIAHSLENGDLKDGSVLPSALIHMIENRRVLYVALLLHDLCKGLEGAHEQLGADLALKLCPRLGLDEAETQLCSWLIADHLLMGKTAFRRDLNDEKTIHAFLSRAHDMERLNLLCVFTAIDIMAVGPGRYTAWQEGLLQELYFKAERCLHGKPIESAEDDPFRDFTPPDDIPHIDITQDIERSATTIRIIAPDCRGLFAKLAGALSASGANILEARIHTLKNGHAHDIFTIQNSSGKPFSERRCGDIAKMVMAALQDESDLPALIRKAREKPSGKDLVFDVPHGAKTHGSAGGGDMALEVHGRDRIGLLYDLARLCRDHGFSIRSAKINTFGLKAVDVFYLDNPQASGQMLEVLQEAAAALMQRPPI